jgi:hypothetical protein
MLKPSRINLHQINKLTIEDNSIPNMRTSANVHSYTIKRSEGCPKRSEKLETSKVVNVYDTCRVSGLIL